MISFKKIITISRPRFWIYGLGPYLLAIAHVIRGGNDFHLLPLIALGLFFTLPANLLVYGVNDIFDQETDLLNPKKDSYEHRLEKKDILSLSIVIILLVIPFVALGLFWGNMLSNIVLIATLFFLVYYSAPPLRFKNIPFLDSATNGLMSVAPFVFALALTQQTLPMFTILAGGLWAMGLHIFSAVPDIMADRQVSITTTATLLGQQKSLLFVSILLTTSTIIGMIFGHWALALIAIPYFIIFITPLAQPEFLFFMYKKIPLVTFVSGTLLFFMILLAT